MSQKLSNRKMEMRLLCSSVRKYSGTSNYKKCVELICKAMSKYPDAPEPHNLFGVILEKRGDHEEAMRHFRAACALDPMYVPAQYNLDHFGTFFDRGKCAFDESDCPQEDSQEYEYEQDELDIYKEK